MTTSTIQVLPLTTLAIIISSKVYISSTNEISVVDLKCKNGTNYNEICSKYFKCDQRETCDQRQYLECTNTYQPFFALRCRCKYGYYEYSADLDKCQGLLGSRCMKDVENDCILSTECKSDYATSVTGTCEFIDGLEEGFDGKCFPKYGGRCEYPTLCDFDKKQVCHQGHCKCDNYDQRTDLHYDPILDNCVAKVGQYCYGTGIAIRITCGKNAGCKVNEKLGIQLCKCDDGFVSDDRGTICLKAVGQPCKIDGECFGSSTCEDRVCVCPPELVNENGRCVAQAGDSCAENSLCIKYSFCSEENKICTCNSSFTKGADGKCYGGASTTVCVDDLSMCNKNYNFECTKWSGNELEAEYGCRCRKGYEYDKKSQKCRGLFYSRCRYNVNDDCGPSLQCTQMANSFNHVCTCLPSLQVNPENRKCFSTYGNNCSSEIECNSEMKLQCDFTIGICQCGSSENYYFDPVLNRCVAKLGSECTDEWGITCGASAICQDNKCSCSNSSLIPNDDNSDCVKEGNNYLPSVANTLNSQLIIVVAVTFFLSRNN